MFKTTAEELSTHKYNSKCGCTKCFFKEIMINSGATYEQIMESLQELQQEGVLEILDYDITGFPTKIKRLATKNQVKSMINGC